MANIGEAPEANQWWRWPLMPFAAVLGGALGAMLFGLVQWFGMKLQGGFSESGWMYLYILPVLTAAAFGWLYTWIACAVAPRGKLLAGTVMTTILVLVGLLNIVIVWGMQKYPVGEAVQLTIGSIASSAAAIVALAQVHGEHKA